MSLHLEISPKYRRAVTPGEKLRKEIDERRAHSPAGFGTCGRRFNSDLTIAPGVGRYNLLSDESSLLLHSPSLSKRGYVSSFSSKAPKFSPEKDLGVPGPNSYSLEQFSCVSGGITGRPGSPSRPSAAFVASGQGRVPYPAPNLYPGPASYSIKPEVGSSPFLEKMQSSSFVSSTKRDSFIVANYIPSPGAYTLPSPQSCGIHSDTSWSRSSFSRFQQRKDGVPGPGQYFFPERSAVFDDPQRSMRTSGRYRGRYCGKQSERNKPTPPTFGAERDRFKRSFVGPLEEIGRLPGPGTHFHSSFHPSFNH